MLALQLVNIEEIRPYQEENVERIQDHREEANQGNNQVEVIEPAKETELDQEEDYTDLLAKAGYIPDQDDDPEEVEERQEEENSVVPPPNDCVATLPRRKMTTTQNTLPAFTEIVIPHLTPIHEKS